MKAIKRLKRKISRRPNENPEFQEKEAVQQQNLTAKRKINLKIPRPSRKRSKPGSAPGIYDDLRVIPDHQPSEPSSELQISTAQISCTDFGPGLVLHTQVHDLENFLKKPPDQNCTVRWINVDYPDLATLQKLQSAYQLHPLAVEDTLHYPQRPKVEAYEQHLFVIARELMFRNGELHTEQVSFFLLGSTLITIQESAGDVWAPVRTRIQKPGSRLRQHDVSFLLYSLLDALVDHCYPILEVFGDQLENLEQEVFAQPNSQSAHKVHVVKRDLLLLRRALWPMRDLVAALQREEHRFISSETKTYLRDIYDHNIQIIDMIETYREICIELREIYLSSISQKMNEIIKVLTIISTFFIPLTFIAGVYGMNFRVFPEIEWTYGYPFFWLICLVIVFILLLTFRRKKWLGNF